MDTVKEEVVVNDPSTGSTQASQTVQHIASPEEMKSARADKKNQVVWYVVGIINTLLVLRIVFFLFGARDVTGPFVSLFKGIFSSPAAGSSYFDTASLLAIVVLSLIGWGVSELINLIQRPAPTKE